MGVYWKVRFLGDCMKNQYIGGELPKKGAWAVCRFKRGLGKKRGEEGGFKPQCTLWVRGAFLLTQWLIGKKDPTQITLCDTNTVTLLIIVIIIDTFIPISK